MKKIYLVATAVLILLAINTCTAITHEYGPFYGKVVDSETGEPIAGAAVLLKINTETILSTGGPAHMFADALETNTNAKGDFIIQQKRIFAFRPMQRWDDNVICLVFKPGYGFFPGHKNATKNPKTIPNIYIQDEKHTTILLPKITTKSEAYTNYTTNNLYWGVPLDKRINYTKKTNIEARNVGLKPIRIPEAIHD